MIVRFAVAVVAIVACAWFALGIREAHDLSSATNALASAQPPSRSAADLVSSRLNDADSLYPGEDVDVLRGRLALAERHDALARQILLRAARGEPDNLEAWVWLARAAGGDAAELRLALNQVARLEPSLRH